MQKYFVNFQGLLLSTDQFYNFIFQPHPESHENKYTVGFHKGYISARNVLNNCKKNMNANRNPPSKNDI